MKFSMKFSMKFILHLISSSYVLGSILSSKVGVEDLITSVSGYEGSQGCVDELSRVKNCILTATKENIIVSCNNYNTNTCQSFYKNPMNLLSSCSSNNFVNALVNSSVNLIIRDLKIKCQKDETGNECPLSEIELNIEESSNTDILNAINNSCKSKICRENTLEFLEYTSEINGKASNLLQSSITQITGAGTISEESLNSVLQDQSNNNNEIKSYIDILKSNNCVSQSNISVASASSDAKQVIKSISGLLSGAIVILIFKYIY